MFTFYIAFSGSSMHQIPNARGGYLGLLVKTRFRTRHHAGRDEFRAGKNLGFLEKVFRF